MDEDRDYRRAVVMALMPMLTSYKPSGSGFNYARFLDQDKFPGIIQMALLLTHPFECREFSWEICYAAEGALLIRTSHGGVIASGMDELHAKRLFEEAQAAYKAAVWR